MTVAALYVDARGCYAGLPGVDVWDESRDARRYAGPHRVVAHPPCARWCRLAGLVEARSGHRRGEDDGCFAAALAAVRRWGGVLEHPAYSDAWAHYGLNRPPSSGGWVVADFDGGWTCHVEQGHYGHRAKKATWLYAAGVELPSLEWAVDAEVSMARNQRRTWRRGVGVVGDAQGTASCELQSRRERSATPVGFRDILLDMAKGPDDE